jgi:hypothetical protein
MEKSFLVESKIFAFLVLDGASRMRVGEKRKSCSDEIVINSRCSEWLASTLKILLGYPEDQEFIKSFRERSKILIAQRGSNQAGRFLEATVFELGGRKGLILIPECRGGWGWLKFLDELRKAAVFLSAKVGNGFGFPYVSINNEGKVEEAKQGLVPYWKGPSFVEVLRSGTVHFARGSRSRLSVASAEPCVLDLLPSVRHAKEDLRTAMDCFSLESPPLELLDKDQHAPSELLDIDKPFCPLGKKLHAHSNLKFEFSKRRTWSKQGNRSNLALGQAVRKNLDHFVETSSHPFLPEPELLLLAVAPAASLGSVPLLVGSGLDSSVPVEKKEPVQAPAVPVERKFVEGLEVPSQVPGSGVAPLLSTGTTEVGKKISSKKKGSPIVCNQNWEKECWRKEVELWRRIFAMYPLVTKEQRQKHLEIWGEMIERKKRESKRELQNLQSSVNYGDIKASSRHRKDKANRS